MKYTKCISLLYSAFFNAVFFNGACLSSVIDPYRHSNNVIIVIITIILLIVFKKGRQASHSFSLSISYFFLFQLFSLTSFKHAPYPSNS